MREILFRGKRLDCGDWISGFAGVKGFDEYEKTCIMQDTMSNTSCNYPFYFTDYEVDPDTVGQYTGFTDKNGKKIFEGDIIKVTDDYGDAAFEDGGIGDVTFLAGMWYVDGEPQNGLYELDFHYFIEVIGNIYDNPELMEA